MRITQAMMIQIHEFLRGQLETNRVHMDADGIEALQGMINATAEMNRGLDPAVDATPKGIIVGLWDEEAGSSDPIGDYVSQEEPRDIQPDLDGDPGYDVYYVPLNVEGRKLAVEVRVLHAKKE
jgi:hypothetical protein